MRKETFLLLLAICVLVVCSATWVLAVDYYVDPVAGSDCNSGLTPDEAFRTITYTLEVIRAENATPATHIPIAKTVFYEDNRQ